MSKFCSKCGTQLADDLMFCGNCGAKVGEAAAPVQASAGMGKIDPMAIVKGTAEPKMNWIVALAAQVLAILLFFLPIVSAKMSAYGMSQSESMTMFKACEDIAPVALPIIFLIIAIAAVAFMALPLIQKTELKAMNALVMLVAQAAFFVINIIMVIIISGKVNDMMGGFGADVSVGFSFAGWLYLIFAALAMFLVGRIVYANKDQIMKK